MVLTLRAGQAGRLIVTRTNDTPASAAPIGAVEVQQVGPVSMETCTDTGDLLVHPMPPGIHAFEVRLAGRTIVAGHIEVQPSPLDSVLGEQTWEVQADEATELAVINISWPQGSKGNTGDKGASAYDVAVQNGYAGTESEWLESLKGEKGDEGATGSEIVVDYAPTSGSQNAVSSGGVYDALGEILTNTGGGYLIGSVSGCVGSASDSIGIGQNAGLSAKYAVTFGAYANGYDKSVTIGHKATSTKERAVAIGYCSSAGYHAVNINGICAGNFGVAIGTGSSAFGSAVVIGADAYALDQYGVVIGQNARAEMCGAVSIGAGAISACESSVTIGQEARNWSPFGVAIGYWPEVTCPGGIAIGNNASTSGDAGIDIRAGGDDTWSRIAFENGTFVLEYHSGGCSQFCRITPTDRS